LRWLGEALPVMRGMLHGEEPTAAGPRYTAKNVRNLPPPIQRHMPLLVGGAGEQVTLKLVARYADANNVGGGIDNVRRKEEVLLQHCETVGRDPAEIERTTGIGTVIIRDSRDEADRVHAAMFEHNGSARRWTDQPIGTPEDVAERLLPYLDLGYRHFVAGFPSPYDEESMTRFATEVRPILERA
jgi:alkanesulfonate monooxygenase SsuD/methylene tetrahydromethanopterin reductase-like flavin-dependent oxidoreductase (luciferase family)